MADELDQTLNEPSGAEARITDLSGKVKTMAGERDTERAARETAESGKAEAERERDFFKDFSGVVAGNPQAKDHQDEILAKVKSGYTTQDATYAVLGAAGKLNQPVVERNNPAGGSADVTINREGNKSVAEMTQAERREALMANESDLVSILSPRTIGQ